MLKPTPPMSNSQRQRLFRERHPGYYQRLHARRRAEVAALQAARMAVAATPAPARSEPLMLPAPVVDPMMLELNELAAKLARERQAVEIPVQKPAA